MKYDEIVQKLHDITFKREQEVYVVSSIENKGNHIGRIKDISLDANCDVVIEVDIDKESITG